MDMGREALTLVPLETLLVIDSLNPLTDRKYIEQLPSFLSALLASPSVSLLATLHTDIPSPTVPGFSREYLPSPLMVLSYLATSILRISNLAHTIAQKRATSRSVQPPVFGLVERREGMLISLHRAPRHEIVVDIEMRRRSGRGIRESFVLTIPAVNAPAAPSPRSTDGVKASALAKITLLEDHPAIVALAADDQTAGQDDDMNDLTFKLGLTEKEKKDRDEIVLPYFDAQKEGGGTDGGRILYQMGREDWDDFDDEEDEI